MCTCRLDESLITSKRSLRIHTGYASLSACFILMNLFGNSWRQALPKIAVSLNAVYRDLERMALPARNSPHASRSPLSVLDGYYSTNCSTVLSSPNRIVPKRGLLMLFPAVFFTGNEKCIHGLMQWPLVLRTCSAFCIIVTVICIQVSTAKLEIPPVVSEYSLSTICHQPSTAGQHKS